MYATTEVESAVVKALRLAGKRAFKHGATPESWWGAEMFRGWNEAVSKAFNALNNIDTDAALAFAESLPRVEFSEEAFAEAEHDSYSRQGVDYLEPSL